MCNFVIRPIKSYATVDVMSNDEKDVVKRGESVEVLHVTPTQVVFRREGGTQGAINFEAFIHSFTANPDDVKKVKDEEAKWFKSK